MSYAQRSQDFGVSISSATQADTAAAFSLPSIPAGAIGCLVTINTNAVRYRTDGNTPTASVGHYVSANANLELFGSDMRNAEFIAASGSAGVFVTYFEG